MMPSRRILLSVVGLIIMSIVVFSPWDAYYKYEQQDQFIESVYVGNFPVWLGPLMGYDCQKDAVENRLNYYNAQIAEYESKRKDPQADIDQIDQIINVSKEKRKRLLKFIFNEEKK